jgi:hypothetical protein
MALLGDGGEYGSPNAKPDMAGGKPALQAYSEALDRCAQRKRWAEEHPGEFSLSDYDQRAADYEAIERGESLMGCCGARTFEPGDSFVSNKEK